MKGGGHRWGTLTHWRVDALCADADQHKEEEEKKNLTWVVGVNHCLHAGGWTRLCSDARCVCVWM